MASTAYVSQILLYDNDDGTQSLRYQKLIVKPNSTTTYVPSIPLLTARIHITASKFEGTNLTGRHLVMDLDDVETITLLPYGFQNTNSLKQLIRQLTSSDEVLATRYRGESFFDGNQSNDNL